MPTKQLTFRANEDEQRILEGRAKAKGVQVSEYIKSIMLPDPAELIEQASGGRYLADAVRMLFVAAEDATDTTEFGVPEAFAWVEALEAHLRWLNVNHWHPECGNRTVALMESIPPDIRRAVETRIRSVLG